MTGPDEPRRVVVRQVLQRQARQDAHFAISPLPDRGSRVISERSPALRSPQQGPQGHPTKANSLQRARPGKNIDETGLGAPVS